MVSTVPRERGIISLEVLPAPQDAIGLLCFRGLLLAHVQDLVCQVLSCQAVLQQVGPQPVLLHRVVMRQVQHFVIAFAGLHEVPHPVWVPLNEPALHLRRDCSSSHMSRSLIKTLAPL